MPRDLLVARFDVTDLSEEERDQLILEVAVQAEKSNGHPDVDGPIIRVVTVPDSVADGSPQKQLLDHVTALVRYWASEEGVSNVPPETPKRDALDGLAFSFLVMLDGGALTGGDWELRFVGEDGKVGENIAGVLHEVWTGR